MAFQQLKQIEEITVHCSATVEGKDYDVNDIDRMHKARGFTKQSLSGKHCGYHVVIKLDGTPQSGRFLTEVGAHCPPNTGRIGICYIGGLDKNRKAKDTRTEAQKRMIIEIIRNLQIVCPNIKAINGHRDHSPDLNGDGIISPNEYMKACPCFDAQSEYKHLLKNGS